MMPLGNQLAELSSDLERAHPSYNDIKDGSPYDKQGNEVPAQKPDNDRTERKDNEDRSRGDNGRLNYDQGEKARHQRCRSSSPQRSPRRDQTQDHRSRHRSQEHHNRPCSPQRGRSRERTPRLPPPPPDAGYTIWYHRKKCNFNCGPEYFARPLQYPGHLTKQYHAADVVSIRYCDFSSDSQAKIGEKFTLSSQGKIYVKAEVPFIFFHVEPGYGIGWMGRRAGNRGLAWPTPVEDHPKYFGIANSGDPKGPAGNSSPHKQLKIVLGNGSESLLSTTHIFAGELVKVPIPSRRKYWGRLTVESYYQLFCLEDFLTARPLSPNANLESTPTGVDLDIDALRTLQTAKDSLVAGWTEQLATLAARQTSISYGQYEVWH